MKFLLTALLIHTLIPNYPFLKTALVEKAFLCLRLLGARRNLTHSFRQVNTVVETDHAVLNLTDSTSLLGLALCSSKAWPEYQKFKIQAHATTEAAVTSCSVGRLNRRVMVHSKHQPPHILSSGMALIWCNSR